MVKASEGIIAVLLGGKGGETRDAVLIAQLPSRSNSRVSLPCETPQIYAIIFFLFLNP